MGRGFVGRAIERGVLVFRIEGDVSGDQMLEALQAAMDDPDVPAGLPSLLDVRKGGRGPDRHEMERVRDFFDEHREFFVPRRAMLVGTLLQYGLGRMAMAMEEDRDMRMEIFRDERAAFDFLLSS